MAVKCPKWHNKTQQITTIQIRLQQSENETEKTSVT